MFIIEVILCLCDTKVISPLLVTLPLNFRDKNCSYTNFLSTYSISLTNNTLFLRNIVTIS